MVAAGSRDSPQRTKGLYKETMEQNSSWRDIHRRVEQAGSSTETFRKPKVVTQSFLGRWRGKA